MDSKRRKIGIVGGMGWPSTMHLYGCICARFGDEDSETGGGPAAPEIVVSSVDAARARKLRPKVGTRSNRDWARYDPYLLRHLDDLARVDGSLAAITSNTPHQRIDVLRRASPLPLRSIADATAARARQAGARRAVLLGTRRTLEGPLYPSVLRRVGIGALRPHDVDTIRRIDALIDGPLMWGRTRAAQQALAETARECGAERPGTVVLLACTEPPLAFPEGLHEPLSTAHGMRWINTLAALGHAVAAAARRTAPAPSPASP